VVERHSGREVVVRATVLVDVLRDDEAVVVEVRRVWW
jgi:hypothetical protein